MDTLSLKIYIYENDKIEYVLNKIGCRHIQYHSTKEFYSCSNYNGDNISAVNVKNNPYLNVTNWTRSNEFSCNADIIDLVQYNKQISFIDAVKYLHEILSLDYKLQIPKSDIVKTDPLQIFKKVENRKWTDVSGISVLSDKILDNYAPLLYIGWFKEGVMPWTAKKYGLAYSYTHKRVIIPMRYWLTGQLIGINSRTTVEGYKELGIKKFYITQSYPKSINLFGLYENYNDIIKAGYVVVYESEKSVLKRDSLNDHTGVALSGHTISDEQVRILIGLNVDIIISLDNDIPIEEVRYICNKFYYIRNVYYTFDKDHLLGEKCSVADATNDVFRQIMSNKIKYDSKERKEYINSTKRLFV